MLVNGVLGPRGDGYVVGATMSAEEAETYHSAQIRSFAAAGADMVSAVTMTYVEEAIGIARAAAAADMPAVISFTVETDGRLPSGQALGEAIEQVDRETARLRRVLHGQLRAPDALRARGRGRRRRGASGSRGCARTRRR